jgi:uncharacterized RDD family membrane protein YckC
MTTTAPPSAVVETYAGFWIRAWATIIDFVLIEAITLPVLWSAYGNAYFESDEFIAGPLDFLLSWILPAVATILFWIYKAATPGKMAVGARIADVATGQPPTTGQYVGRYLGYFVSALPLGLGFIWVAFDPKRQSFHDKLAGTVVVRRKREVPEVFEPNRPIAGR